MRRTTAVLTVVLASAALVQMLAGTQDVDVAGAWAVTITNPPDPRPVSRS